MPTVSRARIAFILAALAAIGPFAIDTYLPALQEIGASLKASDVETQQTLTAYLAAFALMVLWHGALSDAWGRRRTILLSLAVFAIASFGCIFATKIEHLWILRALQGTSAGAGTVIGRAIVRDLYDGADAQRLMSRVAIMFALAPSIAPIIGGWLSTWFGWRSIFVFLTSFIVILLTFCSYWLPETLPPEKRQTLHPGNLLRNCFTIMSDRHFLSVSFSISLCFAGFFIYVLSAPKFLIELLGLSQRSFLWLFGPAMFGMVVGAVLAGRLAGKKPIHRIVRLGFIAMASAAAINVLICLFLPARVPWNVLPFLLFNLGIAMTMPGLTLFVLDCFPERRGLASSCQTFIQLGVNSLLAGLIVPLVWHSTLALALLMIGLLTLGFVAAIPYFTHPQKSS